MLYRGDPAQAWKLHFFKSAIQARTALALSCEARNTEVVSDSSGHIQTIPAYVASRFHPALA